MIAVAMCGSVRVFGLGDRTFVRKSAALLKLRPWNYIFETAQHSQIHRHRKNKTKKQKQQKKQKQKKKIIYTILLNQ